MFSLFEKSKKDILFSYAEKGNVSKLVELIEEGTPFDFFHKSNGLTPLLVATENEQYDCVKELLRKGADPNLGAKRDSSVSDEEREKHSEIYDKLDYLSGRKPEGTTALTLACYNNYADLAKLLIHHGADMNLVNEDGHAPLHYSCSMDRIDIVRLLIDAGATVDPPFPAEPVLLLSIQSSKSIDIIRMLIERGANVNLDYNGTTPLQLACAEGRMDVVEFLIKNHASINMKAQSGRVAIHSTVMENKYSIVKYLIDNGANIDLEGADNFTPLQLAAAEGHLDIVKLLVKAGADIQKKNLKYKNMSAIDLASETGHRKIEKYLRKELNG